MNCRVESSMLPLLPNVFCCEGGPLANFTMPRVVPDQREKFENDELFRKLSRESEVRYTGFRDRPIEERQLRFQTEVREGHADIAFVGPGTNLSLQFLSNAWSDNPEDRIPTREFVDFEREPGKVHLKSQFIMNGVCVIWRGYIDSQRLDGTGCLEFDDERAQAEDSVLRDQIHQYNQKLQEFAARHQRQFPEVEDSILREQIEAYNRRLRDFEDRQRQYRETQERQAEAEAEAKPRPWQLLF